MKASSIILVFLLSCVNALVAQTQLKPSEPAPKQAPEVLVCAELLPPGSPQKWKFSLCGGQTLNREEIVSGLRIRCVLPNSLTESDGKEAKETAEKLGHLDTVSLDMQIPPPGGNVVVVWPHGASRQVVKEMTIDLGEYVQNELVAINNLDRYNAVFAPNPVSSSGHIHIKDSGSIQNVSITDSQGTSIPHIQPDSEGNINLEGLKPGIYFITVVYSDGRRVTMKIVKES